eukprot:854942-Prymnesium_polylepis.2
MGRGPPSAARRPPWSGRADGGSRHAGRGASSRRRRRPPLQPRHWRREAGAVGRGRCASPACDGAQRPRPPRRASASTRQAAHRRWAAAASAAGTAVAPAASRGRVAPRR